MARLLGITRQTVHDWAEDGTLMPIYDKGTLTFQRDQVEQLGRRRAARKKIGTSVDIPSRLPDHPFLAKKSKNDFAEF